MKRFSIMLFALALAAPVFAQELAEDPTTTPTQWYNTVLGIVAATALIVGILKKLLAKVPVLSQVPLWVYAVVVSFGLTYAANQVWQTMPGELWPLTMQTVIGAATASGFWSWFNSDTTIVKSLMRPLAASTAAMDVISKG